MTWLRSRFFKQLLIASLVLPMLFFGFNSADRVGAQFNIGRPLIRIDDVKIDAKHAQHALQYLAQSGNMNTDTLRNQTWDVLLLNASRLAFAHALGVWVSDEKVANTLQTLPHLKDPITDKFSDALFDRYLTQRNFNRRDFVEEVRADLQREAAAELFDFTRLPTAVSSKLGQLYGKFLLEQRTIDYVVLRQTDMQQKITTPDEATLSAFYDKNNTLFMAPERRTIQAISISPQTLPLNISKEQLNEAYQRNRAQYTTPAKRTVYQLIFKTAEEAAQAKPQFKSGEKFADTLKTLKQDEKTARLGDLTRADLPAEVSKVVFALPVQGFSEPQKNAFGWAVYYVAHETPEQTKPLTAVEQELTTQLKTEQGRRMAVQLLERMQEDVDGGMSIDELARKHQQTITTLAQIDAQGRDTRQRFVLPQQLAQSTFLQRAFATQSSNDVLSLELPNQQTIFYTVQKTEPAHTPPLATVRDEVLSAYKKEQARTQNTQHAQTIAEAVNKTGSWSADANALGIKTTQRQRQEADPVLSDDTLKNLFLSDVKHATVGTTKNGDVVVAMTSHIVAGDPAVKAASLGNNVLTEVGKEIERTVLSKRTQNVQLNRAAFDALMTP